MILAFAVPGWRESDQSPFTLSRWLWLRPYGDQVPGKLSLLVGRWRAHEVKHDSVDGRYPGALRRIAQRIPGGQGQALEGLVTGGLAVGGVGQLRQPDLVVILISHTSLIGQPR